MRFGPLTIGFVTDVRDRKCGVVLLVDRGSSDGSDDDGETGVAA